MLRKIENGYQFNINIKVVKKSNVKVIFVFANISKQCKKKSAQDFENLYYKKYKDMKEKKIFEKKL